MNLIDILKNELSGDAINSLSHKLDITPAQTQTGMSAIIPVVLAGILKKASSSGSLGSLSSIFTGNLKSVETKPETEIGDVNSMLSRGSMLLADLFGGKTDEVSNEIAQKTNLSTDKSKTLLTMAAPLVMEHIDKLISNKGWSMPDFVGKLSEEKSSIENHLPAGLISGFGLAGLSFPNLNQAHIPDTHIPKNGDYPNANIPPIERGTPQNTIIPEPPSSSGNVLKWIIIIAILVLIAWWFLGRDKTGNENVQYRGDSTVSNSSTNTQSNSTLATQAGDAVAGSLNEAGDWVYNLGTDKTLRLPDGATLNVGENSAEAKLISLIEDNNNGVKDATWFSLDRLFFETGESTLKPESQDQLSNIAAIMRSYPKVKLEIRGYTDNSGTAEENMKLSTDRANAAMKDLIGLGVSADQLKAEGYGQDHPIGDNSTDEGKAQNRRIEIRATE